MALPAFVSPVAERYEASVRMKGLKTDLRRGPVRAVIVHFTGAGVQERFLREGVAKKDTSPFDTAVRLYTQILPGQDPHYVVGQGGECVAVTPENRVAYHVGTAQARQYNWWTRKRHPHAYDWWYERFKNLESPRDLADGKLWQGGSCNANTIGIEVAPHVDKPLDPFSPKAVATLRTLIADILARNNLPFDRKYIIGHCEAHPVSRTDKLNYPFDPKLRQIDLDKL